VSFTNPRKRNSSTIIVTAVIDKRLGSNLPDWRCCQASIPFLPCHPSPSRPCLGACFQIFLTSYRKEEEVVVVVLVADLTKCGVEHSQCPRSLCNITLWGWL
jgi:hypothetical protein